MIFEKQTNDFGKHYLYIHVRLDTKKEFYVGVGTKYKSGKDYSRAKAKGPQRSTSWRSITSVTSYKIIILFESDDYKIIKQKEKEMILQYGRTSDGSGSLCNISMGGDGCTGYRNKNLMKPVYLYLKTGEFFKEFESFADCAKHLKTASVSVSLSIDKNHLIKKHILKSYKTDKVDPILDIKDKLKKRLSKPVYQYDDCNNLVKKWPSTSEASRVLGISGGHIREVANGSKVRKKAGGFIWKY